MNYVKLGLLLTELGFVPVNVAPDSVERELLFDMWNMLKGEETSGVSVLNCKKFMLAVQGITLDKGDSESSKVTQELDNTNKSCVFYALGFDANGVLVVSHQDVKKVFLKFKPLYINRMQHVGQTKRVTNYDDNCTFRPQLSRTSEWLAQQKRRKMLSRGRTDDDHEKEHADDY